MPARAPAEPAAEGVERGGRQPEAPREPHRADDPAPVDARAGGERRAEEAQVEGGVVDDQRRGADEGEQAGGDLGEARRARQHRARDAVDVRGADAAGRAEPAGRAVGGAAAQAVGDEGGELGARLAVDQLEGGDLDDEVAAREARRLEVEHDLARARRRPPDFPVGHERA